MSGGETDLAKLIEGLRPEIRVGEFVFCRAESGKSAADYARFDLLGSFNEGGEDGITLFLPVEGAVAAGLAFAGTYRIITLKIHSSLQAVGLTATVSGWLAEAGIPANIVAAFFHDHIFVPADKAEQALAVLISHGHCKK